MRWFGEPWPGAHLRAPVCEDDAERAPIPVGEPCLFCEEPIGPIDRGILTPVIELVDGEQRPRGAAAHIECWTRQIFGSLSHQEGRCSCYGGTDHDTPGLTRRQEALAVMAWIYENGMIA